ncbi:hypothetical protein D9M71_696490 [compost metagenome]
MPVAIPDSSRTFAANWVWYPGPVGISAFTDVPPDDTSIKSTPSFLKRLASSTVSSGFQPSSTQSVADSRTNTGNSSGQTSRTASVTCKVRRIRLSKQLPYSSRRWLLSGERN